MFEYHACSMCGIIVDDGNIKNNDYYCSDCLDKEGL